jgi:hypothetical protein
MPAGMSISFNSLNVIEILHLLLVAIAIWIWNSDKLEFDDLQEHFERHTFSPSCNSAINEKAWYCLLGCKIARATPLKNLVAGKFLTANEVDHFREKDILCLAVSDSSKK